MIGRAPRASHPKWLTSQCKVMKSGEEWSERMEEKREKEWRGEKGWGIFIEVESGWRHHEGGAHSHRLWVRLNKNPKSLGFSPKSYLFDLGSRVAGPNGARMGRQRFKTHDNQTKHAKVSVLTSNYTRLKGPQYQFGPPTAEWTHWRCR